MITVMAPFLNLPSKSLRVCTLPSSHVLCIHVLCMYLRQQRQCMNLTENEIVSTWTLGDLLGTLFGNFDSGLSIKDYTHLPDNILAAGRLCD